MKRLIYLLFLLPILTIGQNQTNWWFFGQNAGLDFTSGSPVPTDVGQLSTIEGCAAIADDCGQLLFYTDGTTIWNQNHVILQNGTGLLGDASSTQSAVIIPLPENPDIYYVFTVDRFLGGAGGDGLNYSIVDMTLDGGLGGVDPNNKNVNLLNESSEKIFAAKAANGEDTWIVAYNPTDQATVRMDRFTSFLLTRNGLDLNATVNSPSPQVVMANGDGRGYLRASPDGTKVAMMTQGLVNPNPNESARGAWLFDFDTATGIVDNPLRLNFRSDYFVYGTEFSLDSNLLYVDSNQFQSGIQAAPAGARELLQYNLQAPNFQNNPVVVFQSDPATTAENTYRGALQMAPDEKIYYTRAGSEWLSVINNPNAIGTACNHVFDGVQLSPGTLSNEGLPPFLNGFFAPSYAILEGCAGQPSQFSIDEIGVCPGSSVVWDFGDPASGAANTSTAPNPVHTYNSAGTYNAVATITTPLNTYQAFRDIVIIDEPTLSGIQDLFACDNDRDGVELIDFSGNINAAFGGQSRSTYNVQVYGSQQDAEDDINRLPVQFSTDSGIFFIRIFGVNSRGCELIQPFEVTVNDEPDIFIDNRFECDEFNDGIELFDLDLIGLEALGANQNPVLFNYSFHRTRGQAESNSNPLPLAYQNTAPNETLFIRIEVNANQLCFNVAEFSINLQTEPEITGDLQIQLCDDVSRDNREQFDLLSLESQIRSMQPAGYTIDFFTNQSDAEANVNSISSDFTNSSPEQTVWVRLTNNADVVCSDVAPIELEVFERPTVEITGDAFKCIGDSIDLTATAGFVSYEWSTLEITPSITVTDPGTYSVTITDSNGCNDFTEFTVTDFEPTQITDIQVEEFTLRNNSIIVSVSGSGPFEYSLDNFTYQESNVFTGLIPGFYTVYVRDLNGCDLIEQDTEIIYGPPFFTPNGDTFNDRWQVTAIETEPDARIFIFDRFGKLLIQLSPLSAGWDGTFLGNPMPSTDYWYLVELADGKSFRGHFSLKR